MTVLFHPFSCFQRWTFWEAVGSRMQLFLGFCLIPLPWSFLLLEGDQEVSQLGRKALLYLASPTSPLMRKDLRHRRPKKQSLETAWFTAGHCQTSSEVQLPITARRDHTPAELDRFPGELAATWGPQHTHELMAWGLAVPRDGVLWGPEVLWQTVNGDST